MLKHANEELRSQFVRRWHIIAMAREQTVAEHSFGVILIARELANTFEFNLTRDSLWWLRLYTACVQHDMHEVIIGDAPTPVKGFPGMRMAYIEAEALADPAWAAMLESYPPDVIDLVKVADIVEAARWVRMWGTGRRAQDVAKQLMHAAYAQLREFVEKHIGLEEDQPMVGYREAHMLVTEIIEERNDG